ncbi:MAG TPA: hypothetical protein EYQ24_09895 [Bacteroidetes bacterium]|nr:hypothetical protein [Bacteroidota bacterium]
MMRTFGLLLLALVALAAAFALGWRQREARIPPPPPPDVTSSPALDSLDARLATLRARLERLPTATPEEENALRRPRTPSYSVHLEWADSLGVPPLSSESELSARLADGRLVPLVDTEHYVVRTLEHSKPFVTPLLRQRLAELGRRFHAELAAAGLPPYRFAVSSALRTADLQRDLGRRNRNAASGTSSHEYGASVDIVTFRYSPPLAPDSLAVRYSDPHHERAERYLADATAEAARARWDHLFGPLTRAMGAMQRDDRLVVLLEAQQPVFHITARD